ncbi:zonular occludens toxin domain-containing protein [Endozoicomonas arenosclerae]|uniref:zonular occludens toxin domain-containing protein n=1 Tax=Endozoicomonas arenosclerae TaxID=1633495 RepID=UPI000784EE0E|nr:zonular occludens toxin domain-containing protein [Endozoicomonas arenosclerae]
MLHIITGRPGASKSLNCFKTVCTDTKYQGRPRYYNNIKLNLLDFQVCKTFQAYFYDIYYPSLKKAEKSILNATVQPIHAQKRFVELADVPWLETPFEKHDPLAQWLKWVKRCYPIHDVRSVTEIQKNCPEGTELTFKDFESLNLHWRHFDDPHQWYDLEGYSVLVVDEAQEFFPVRSGKDRVPVYAAKFERHRHDSFDVILVTQHPNFLDIHIRRLAGHHTHYFNFWGSAKVTRYIWDKCVDPDDHFERKEASKSVVGKPKKYFGVYFSAFEHTHKLKLPKALFLIPILLLVIVLALYKGLSTLTRSEKTPEEATKEQESSLLPLSKANAREPVSLEQYIQERTPRLSGLKHTAPIYDPLTKPKAFPKPQNCILWNVDTPEEECICYSQRITRMKVPDYLCRSTVRNGYFDETLSDKHYLRNKPTRRELKHYKRDIDS